MKLKLLSVLALLSSLGILTGCATGYRSETVFKPLAGNKYNLGVTVIKVKKTIFGVKESVLYDDQTNVWERGKPMNAKVTWGDDQSGVFVNSFVPKTEKSDVVVNVEVKESGNVKLQSKFIIKQ